MLKRLVFFLCAIMFTFNDALRAADGNSGFVNNANNVIGLAQSLINIRQTISQKITDSKNYVYDNRIPLGATFVLGGGLMYTLTGNGGGCVREDKAWTVCKNAFKCLVPCSMMYLLLRGYKKDIDELKKGVRKNGEGIQSNGKAIVKAQEKNKEEHEQTRADARDAVEESENRVVEKLEGEVATLKTYIVSNGEAIEVAKEENGKEHALTRADARDAVEKSEKCVVGKLEGEVATLKTYIASYGEAISMTARSSEERDAELVSYINGVGQQVRENNNLMSSLRSDMQSQRQDLQLASDHLYGQRCLEYGNTPEQIETLCVLLESVKLDSDKLYNPLIALLVEKMDRHELFPAQYLIKKIEGMKKLGDITLNPSGLEQLIARGLKNNSPQNVRTLIKKGHERQQQILQNQETILSAVDQVARPGAPVVYLGSSVQNGPQDPQQATYLSLIGYNISNKQKAAPSNRLITRGSLDDFRPNGIMSGMAGASMLGRSFSRNALTYQPS